MGWLRFSKTITLKLNHRLSQLRFSLSLACEQALHLGDIVKNRRPRGTREETRKETRKRGAGERKAPLSLARSRAAHFARPKRRACLQATLSSIIITSGGSRGGRGARTPLICRPNWGSKGRKKIFRRPPPSPPLSKGLDDRSPPTVSGGLDPPRITIISNEPWNTETHKTDRNPQTMTFWTYWGKLLFPILSIRGPLRWLTAAKTQTSVSFWISEFACFWKA